MKLEFVGYIRTYRPLLCVPATLQVEAIRYGDTSVHRSSDFCAKTALKQRLLGNYRAGGLGQRQVGEPRQETVTSYSRFCNSNRIKIIWCSLGSRPGSKSSN